MRCVGFKGPLRGMRSGLRGARDRVFAGGSGGEIRCARSAPLQPCADCYVRAGGFRNGKGHLMLLGRWNIQSVRAFDDAAGIDRLTLRLHRHPTPSLPE